MEVSGSQRDRSRPPSQQPRAPSRSSTNTSTRMTPKSSNSSSTNLPNSPQPSSAVLPHRFHQSTASRSSIGSRGRRPSLSREQSEESKQQTGAPLSSFLQERLQRERKLESERSSRRLSADLSASADFTMRATQSSPVRSGQPDNHRPRSSGGGEPTTRKKRDMDKGMGLREMEQVWHTLRRPPLIPVH